jgi:hypothetical protein
MSGLVFVESLQQEEVSSLEVTAAFIPLALDVVDLFVGNRVHLKIIPTLK